MNTSTFPTQDSSTVVVPLNETFFFLFFKIWVGPLFVFNVYACSKSCFFLPRKDQRTYYVYTHILAYTGKHTLAGAF